MDLRLLAGWLAGERGRDARGSAPTFNHNRSLSIAFLHLNPLGRLRPPRSRRALKNVIDLRRLSGRFAAPRPLNFFGISARSSPMNWRLVCRARAFIVARQGPFFN